MEVIAILGYPEKDADAERHSKARKPLDEIVGMVMRSRKKSMYSFMNTTVKEHIQGY